MSLSSLLVQHEAATMRQVEEALARQVIYGGDLVTNLLEVAPIDEGLLTAILGESMRLAPAPAGALPVAEDVRTLVARDVASQRAIVPLEVRDGILVIAVAEPMSHDFAEQLSLGIGLPIEQRAASAVRIRHAISRLYNLPLDRRTDRLVERLATRKPAAGAPSLGAAPGAQGATTPAFGTPVIPLVQRRAGPPASARHVTTSAGFPAPEAGPPSSSPYGGPPAPSPARSLSYSPPVAPALAPAPGLLQREVPNHRAANRRRGPLTADAARQEAEKATDRDALLDLFFDFSRQFFDYAALFLIHGDIAEGREAFGSGAPRDKVLGMGIPLDLPSVVATAREEKVPLIAKVGGEGLEGVLLADLGRPRFIEVAFIPLVVRTRAVAVLIGDCGASGIDRGSVTQVSDLAGEIGKAFERIIVRRKLDGFVAGGPSGGVKQAGKVDIAAVALKRPVKPSASSAPPGAPARTQTAKMESAPPLPSPSPGRVSFRPGHSTVPPPQANIAAMRKISGPPIPREEPATPAQGMPAAAPSPPAPEVVMLGEVTSPEIMARNTRPPEAMEADFSASDDAGPQIEAAREELAGDSPDEDHRLLYELSWDRKSDPRLPPLPPSPSQPILGEPDIPEPPPSSSMAVAPHLPPHAHPTDIPLPPVVVDLDEDIARLLDRVIEGDPEDEAEGELLRQGDKAMAVVMARFPGPVTMDRQRIATMARPPRASDCGPVLRLVARERKVALPFVLARLNDPSAEARGWATHLLCELAYLDAVPPLLLRLRDVDASTRMSAALALAVIGRTYPAEVRDAVLSLAHAIDAKDRTAAMHAMAELRLPALVPDLVRALADGDDAVVSAAHAALVQVTRQDFGTDARPWLKWWETHGAKHRVEWLIDALTHDVAEIRRWAGEELRTVTKEYFGYASDLPPRDRERARQRYRDWWLTEGKARFARAPFN